MNDHDRTEATVGIVEPKAPVDFRNLLPVIEDIILMVHESLRKIPHATSNLNKVTQRNERVTAEILSVVDRLNDNTDELSQGLSAISNSAQRRKELQKEIDTVLSESKNGKAAPVVLRLQNLWNEYESLPSIDEIIQSMLKSIVGIQNDSTNIVMALQVQDITAQHVEAINHLIESVHNRLTLILQKFYGVEFQTVIPDSSRKKLSDYIAKQSKKTHSHDVLPENELESQNEIDRMFKEK